MTKRPKEPKFDSELFEALAALLQDKRPKLMQGDLVTIAITAAVLSRLMGCILAPALAQEPEEWESALDILRGDIEKTALTVLDIVGQWVGTSQNLETTH